MCSECADKWLMEAWSPRARFDRAPTRLMGGRHGCPKPGIWRRYGSGDGSGYLRVAATQAFFT